MELPDSLKNYLTREAWGGVAHLEPLSGGCISNALRLETQRGPVCLLKINSRAPRDMFVREAEGLEALVVPGGPRLPRVYAYDQHWILLEFVASVSRKLHFAERLGEQLARLHATTGPGFGFEHDNYLGATPQPNRWTLDGYSFFAEQRLSYQARLALQRGLLSVEEVQTVERIADRLPLLIPEQPASLLHGDLWGGNVIVGPEGEPVLIDPAAHYGWAEAELAMTSLFGGFDPTLYSAYEATRALAPDYRERFPLYNLYHLLNHLNLFGSAYHAQVSAVLRRYL
ncbi:MAG: fructosamine kinase family protein [Anaerolineales bacterium]